MPAPRPKPAIVTFFQSKPTAANLASTVSTSERPKSSTSCSMSRSSFSKLPRSRRKKVPSITSGDVRLNSSRPSPAACCDQATDINAAEPKTPDRSLSTSFSALGWSPTQTTRELGLCLFPASSVVGSGPSGVVAATLWSVKRRLSHSDFSLSRSSSSFFFCPSESCTAAFLSGLDVSSPVFCSSSCRVGKMRTTCALSEASAAREKASLIASSPTL
mmetsp:Transcript_91617/g.296425  ORF Transcript_91617/g.296425 Transcript_91617/m.296425 type:complete len:217 (+) Transcript_91617:485-1135(+)